MLRTNSYPSSALPNRLSLVCIIFIIISFHFALSAVHTNAKSSDHFEDKAVIEQFVRDGNLDDAVENLSFDAKLGQMSIASLYTFWKVENKNVSDDLSGNHPSAYSLSSNDSLSYKQHFIDECGATKALLEMTHLRTFLKNTKVGAFVADPPPIHQSLRRWRMTNGDDNKNPLHSPTLAQQRRWNKGQLNAVDWRCVSIILHELSTETIGIPVMVISRGDHGAALVHGATIFPQPLASVSSFNVELVEKMSSTTAKDTRLSGAHMILAPCLEVDAHPAWPHHYQCMGEDTYVAAVMGVAITAGLQGYPISINNTVKVAASFTHFIAAGQAMNGRDGGPANVPISALMNVHLPPYAAAIATGIRGGIVSTNELNSVPNAVSKSLTRSLLRDELSFNGTLISDVTTIEALYELQHVAHSERQAIYLAIEKGTVDASLAYNTHLRNAHHKQDHYQIHDTDSSRTSDSNLEFISSLRELVQGREIPMSRVQECVKRVMQLKHDLGLLSPPIANSMPSMNELLSTVGIPVDRAAALLLARESIVLLENDNHFLPLSFTISDTEKTPSSISEYFENSVTLNENEDNEPDGDEDDSDTIDYVLNHKSRRHPLRRNERTRFANVTKEMTQPNCADKHKLSISKLAIVGPCAHSLTALSGGMTIHEQGAHANHEFAFGATILEALLELRDLKNVNLNITYAKGVSITGDWLPESVKNAVKIVEEADVGIVCLGEGPYWGKRHDELSLEMPAVQQRLLNELTDLGTDIVLILIEGRPRVLSDVRFRESIRSVLVSFLPGPEGGQAIAETLFGLVNPSGKLPISYPRHVDNILPYYHPFSQKSQYNPQWPFGHGLSYSRFSYSKLQISSSELFEDESLTVEVTVTNEGPYDGKEVVILYVTDLYRSVAPEVRRVKGFEKISLQASESKVVPFSLTMDSFTFYSPSQHRIVEAGTFCITISSLSKCFTLTLKNDDQKRIQPTLANVQDPSWWPYTSPPPAISEKHAQLHLVQQAIDVTPKSVVDDHARSDYPSLSENSSISWTAIILAYILGMITFAIVISLQSCWTTCLANTSYNPIRNGIDVIQNTPLLANQTYSYQSKYSEAH